MNRIPKIDIITLFLSAYLINMFHVNFVSTTIQQLVVWGLCLLYLTVNNRFIIRLFRRTNGTKTQIFILLFFLYFFWAVVAFLIGPHDVSYISSILSMILLFLYMLVIIVRLMKKGNKENLITSFFFTYIYSMTLYVLVSTIMIVVPDVKDTFLGVLSMDSFNMEKVSNLYYGTRVGWMGFSGYTCGLKCSLGCCMCLYYIVENIKMRKKNDPRVFTCLMVLLLGNVYYSRTGLAISAVCVMTTLFYIAFIQGKILTFIKYCVLISIVLMVGVFFVRSNIENSLTMQWAFEAIENFFNNGEFSTTSYSKLQAMYFWPPVDTIIIGDGRYAGVGVGYYMNVDVGLMRNIFYFGIIGTLTLYGMMTYSIIQTGKQDRKIMTVLLFVLFIGYEYKGESTPLLLPLVFLIFCMMNYLPKHDIR